MKGIVVDTDVFSFIFKGDTRTQIYRPMLNSFTPCLSFLTVAELYRWSIVRKWGVKQVDSLKREIAGYFILEHDDATAWEWARITSVPGKQIGFSDAWVAASAIRNGLPLLTNNRKHFESITALRFSE